MKKAKKREPWSARRIAETLLDRLETPRRATLAGTLLACCLVLAVYYGVVIDTDRSATERLDQLAVVKGEVTAIEQTLAERPKLDEELTKAEQRLAEARTLLPDESQTGQLIAVVNAAAERSNVTITNLDARTLTQPTAAPQPNQPPAQAAPQPNQPPAQTAPQPNLQLLRRPFPTTVRGTAQAIGQFLAELSRARPLIIVEGCDLHTIEAKQRRGPVEANLLLSTYVVPKLASERGK